MRISDGTETMEVSVKEYGDHSDKEITDRALPQLVDWAETPGIVRNVRRTSHRLMELFANDGADARTILGHTPYGMKLGLSIRLHAPDIQDDESRLVNSKNKLMQVENDREYQAMIREMDTMERQNQTREEERMALQEERSLQESNLHSVEETWNELKTELESQRENLEKRLAECRTKLEALEAQRAEVSALISPPVLSRYEFIRNRLRHPVIVPVEAGVCSGCHIAIPPQVFIDLQRGNHIMSCPNCQRLMYWAHDYQDPDAPRPQPRTEEAAE